MVPQVGQQCSSSSPKEIRILETISQGLTVLSCIHIIKSLVYLPPCIDPKHAGGFGRGETTACDRDLEAGLMALEAVNQDKNPKKDAVKAIDQAQWENPTE